jgi:UDP-2-acetamido-3-amino-2,3-dideoxy-glucuronate N-acetyltransferase
VAVLGCGAWGLNHVRVFARLGVLAVACDEDQARLAEVKARHPGLETSTDPDLVLARPDVTAVVVATPPAKHADLAQRALAAGKDVLVEKPLALSAAEGERLVAAAERFGRVLAVGHVLEYHPAVEALGRLVAEGRLGRVRYASSNRLNLGRLRAVENVLWSFAPHDVAILLRLFGDPVEVSCTGAPPDTALLALEFGDVRAHVFVSWLHPFKEHRLVVVGDRAMAVFDDLEPWASKLVVHPYRVDAADGVPVARRGEAEPVPLVAGEPLVAQAEAFLAGRPRADGRSALAVLRVLECAERGGSGVTQDVHPTAIVDPGARIGAGTKVWHWTHVMDGAVVGRDAVLGQNVFVGRGVRIGDGVRVQNNVSVYEGVELEDFVFCGPSAVFTNVVQPRSEIDRRHELRRTLVRRGASIGANATVVCGTTIGQYALVGAGAVVTRDVPDHALVVGVPARVTGWVCACGERLPFGDREEAACPACAGSYRRAGEGAARA